MNTFICYVQVHLSIRCIRMLFTPKNLSQTCMFCPRRYNNNMADIQVASNYESHSTMGAPHRPLKREIPPPGISQLSIHTLWYAVDAEWNWRAQLYPTSRYSRVHAISQWLNAQTDDVQKFRLYFDCDIHKYIAPWGFSSATPWQRAIANETCLLW